MTYNSIGLVLKNPNGPIWYLMRPRPLCFGINHHQSFVLQEVECQVVNGKKSKDFELLHYYNLFQTALEMHRLCGNFYQDRKWTNIDPDKTYKSLRMIKSTCTIMPKLGWFLEMCEDLFSKYSSLNSLYLALPEGNIINEIYTRF